MMTSLNWWKTWSAKNYYNQHTCLSWWLDGGVNHVIKLIVFDFKMLMYIYVKIAILDGLLIAMFERNVEIQIKHQSKLPNTRLTTSLSNKKEPTVCWFCFFDPQFVTMDDCMLFVVLSRVMIIGSNVLIIYL